MSKLTEKQILAYLESHFDEEDCGDNNEDDLEHALQNVYAPEINVAANKVSLEDYSDEDEVVVGEIELPTISMQDLSAMGLEVQRASNSMQFTRRKEIKWINRQMRESTIDAFDNQQNEHISVESPFYYFQKYFPDNFFEETAYFTNLYAAQKSFILYKLKYIRYLITFILSGNLSFKQCSADEMLQYYRINIRTSKWTVRVIMHFVDLAIAAAWMEYRNACKINSVPKKDVLDSLHFRAEVANVLLKKQAVVNLEQPRTRGRPTRGRASTTPTTAPSTPTPTPSTPTPTPFTSTPTASTPTPTSSTSTFKRKRLIQELPDEAIKTDSINHLPECANEKNAGRCKMADCNKKSFIICKKCNAYLCVKCEKKWFCSISTKMIY